MISTSSISAYNRIFSMTNSINRFIAEASAAKSNIASNLGNVASSQVSEGIGRNINLLA